MANRILVTPGELRNVARQFQQGGDQTEQLTNRLTQSLNGMQGQWDGMTKERFFQEFQNANNNMKQFVQMLESISQQLNSIADRFEQLDNAGAR
ncbi:WXG100 family type VII secretion target [Paenibacillus turpanensis]|uniref:WXG100 family type VII secretion target n=1 Tax=Paenibacillus turpanensis TaxID=2689078 RepID=UPI001408773C|nr:WXG100 family type VII secretion target [Paenibacillus turpanensis]